VQKPTEGTPRECGGHGRAGSWCRGVGGVDRRAKGGGRRGQMSQKEERWLWSMLDECDAEQVKEEKRAVKKMKRKVGLARIKMKAGKNQPSMRDMLSKGPARSGENQSPKTINASGTSQERSSINVLTGSESNNIVESNQSTSLAPGRLTSPVPGQSANMRSGHGSVCSDRSGRKNCQGGIINRVPELMLQMKNKNTNQSVLCGENSMLKKHEADASMSVDQLSAVDDIVFVRNDNVECQVDGEMSVKEYVCTECGVQQTECKCEGSDAIGRELTNQNAEQTICSTVINNTQSKGGPSSSLGRGAHMPKTAVVKDVNIQFENNSHKGRGARVTIPAVFRKKVYTPLKKKNIHRNGESVEGNLTPVKRKLLQNSNTQTMLRIFKQYTDETEV
jgi:hypothetical protein